MRARSPTVKIVEIRNFIHSKFWALTSKRNKKMSNSGGFRMDVGLRQTLMTMPDTDLCHYITDDELDRLSEMRKEPVMEIFLCATGAFMGALIPALQSLSIFNSDPTKMDGFGLLTMFVAVGTLTVALVSGSLWHQRLKSHKSLVATIRGRPRVPIRLTQTDD
jgi:hypothetical protein